MSVSLAVGLLLVMTVAVFRHYFRCCRSPASGRNGTRSGSSRKSPQPLDEERGCGGGGNDVRDVGEGGKCLVCAERSAFKNSIPVGTHPMRFAVGRQYRTTIIIGSPSSTRATSSTNWIIREAGSATWGNEDRINSIYPSMTSSVPLAMPLTNASATVAATAATLVGDANDEAFNLNREIESTTSPAKMKDGTCSVVLNDEVPAAIDGDLPEDARPKSDVAPMRGLPDDQRVATAQGDACRVKTPLDEDVQSVESENAAIGDERPVVSICVEKPTPDGEEDDDDTNTGATIPASSAGAVVKGVAGSDVMKSVKSTHKPLPSSGAAKPVKH